MADTLEELFVDELKDIYSAEKQGSKAYPKVAKAAESDELKQALQAHMEETKGQIERLEQIFEMLEKRPGGKTCEGMKGVLEESAEAIEEGDKGAVRDAQLIGATQRAEHYEIAGYGTVVALAKALGKDEIAGLLAQTLAEEKATDQKLTEISSKVNQEALASSEGEDEDEDKPRAKKAAGKSASKKGSKR